MNVWVLFSDELYLFSTYTFGIVEVTDLIYCPRSENKKDIDLYMGRSGRFWPRNSDILM